MRALAAAAVLLAACLNLARDFPATNPRGLCGNGAHDGQESDVDCGGPCGPCVAGESCSASSDCETEICDAGVCAPPRCDDGLRGSTETDVDCGGECAPCGLGRRCGTANDCAFARCI